MVGILSIVLKYFLGTYLLCHMRTNTMRASKLVDSSFSVPWVLAGGTSKLVVIIE